MVIKAMIHNLEGKLTSAREHSLLRVVISAELY